MRYQLTDFLEESERQRDADERLTMKGIREDLATGNDIGDAGSKENEAFLTATKDIISERHNIKKGK